MSESYNRYDISDELWAAIEPHTIGNPDSWGGNAVDTRTFINAVFWILRTGAPWRDLPSSYGNWSGVNRRFCRWRDKNIWENIFLAIIGGQCSLEYTQKHIPQHLKQSTNCNGVPKSQG